MYLKHQVLYANDAPFRKVEADIDDEIGRSIDHGTVLNSKVNVPIEEEVELSKDNLRIIKIDKVQAKVPNDLQEMFHLN